mmetsp:Transcript_19843/g.55180  ORF Transcript_19843/g.55180 Transcript_19843/m.55180 type:complete len:89 (-) Transcript_19843:2000-2266(-)
MYECREQMVPLNFMIAGLQFAVVQVSSPGLCQGPGSPDNTSSISTPRLRGKLSCQERSQCSAICNMMILQVDCTLFPTGLLAFTSRML